MIQDSGKQSSQQATGFSVGGIEVSSFPFPSPLALVRVAMSRFLFFALLTFAPLLHARADGVEIRQRYKDGFRYKQQVTIAQESSVSTGLTNTTTKSDTAFDLESTATMTQQGNGNVMSVEVRYTKIVMSVDRDGKVFRFDSAMPGEQSMAGPLQTLAGLPGRGFNLIINEHGAIVSVDASNVAVSTMASANRVTATSFREMFEPESIKRIVAQTMICSPKGMIPKINDSWPLSQELMLPGIGKLTVTGNYTLAGMAESEGIQCAKIAVDGTYAQEPTAKKLDLTDNDRFDTLSRQMNLKLDGSTLTGSILFDPAISFPRELNITQTINITAKIPDGTANVIKMPIKQTISVKLVEMSEVRPQ